MGWTQQAQLRYDHARAEGYEAYYEGLTPSDVPYDEYSGHVRDWWLSGWRAARDADSESQRRWA